MLHPWLLLRVLLSAVAASATSRDYEQQCGTYTLVELHLSWSDARSYCQSRGGELANMRSVPNWLMLSGCRARLVQPHNKYRGIDDVWLGGFREHGTLAVWRWAADEEVFWRNGSVGGCDCWWSQLPSQRSDLQLFQNDDENGRYESPRYLTTPVATSDKAVCLRASLPESTPTAASQRSFHRMRRFNGLEHCMGGRWWAEACERRLMFVCEGGLWPPLVPPPPAAPPEPPLPPFPPLQPPAPPITPARAASSMCCIYNYRWAPPCCACNHYCRDTLIVAAIVLVCALLPTCVYQARRQCRPCHSSSHHTVPPADSVIAHVDLEFTAWPSMAVSPLQFACFQTGLLLIVVGGLPSFLHGVRRELLSHSEFAHSPLPSLSARCLRMTPIPSDCEAVAGPRRT